MGEPSLAAESIPGNAGGAVAPGRAQIDSWLPSRIHDCCDDTTSNAGLFYMGMGRWSMPMCRHRPPCLSIAMILMFWFVSHCRVHFLPDRD